MSINSMANAATARRADIRTGSRAPRSYSEIAAAAAAPPPPPRDPVVAAAQGLEGVGTEGDPVVPPPAAPANQVDTALNLLFGYIPTEVVTLYVAVLAAIGKEGEVTRGEWISFVGFLVACPGVVWLTFAAKLKGLQKPLPFRFSEWPAWEMSVATISFATWAFALPQSPFSACKWYSSSLSGVAVLIVSTFLGLMAPFFQNDLGSARPTDAQ